MTHTAITTSRRTPPEIEGIIKKEFALSNLAELLVIANEKNIASAVGGILALSEVIVVSGESISMVSEAASSGKPAVVFDLQKKTKKISRHELFLQNLNQKEFISRTSVDALPFALENIAINKQTLKTLDDNKKIKQALRSIL